MGWGYAIGAGIQQLTNLQDNALAFLAENTQFHHNAQLMQRQMDWQERMSSTAHQREMADLRAAGLNPLLTVNGGQGASTGSAGLAQVGQVQVQPSRMMEAISTANELKNSEVNREYTKAMTDTETNKQNLIAAQEINELLEAQKRRTDLTYQEREIISQMQNINAQTAFYNAQSSAVKMNAETMRMTGMASAKESEANANYTKEKTKWVDPNNIAETIGKVGTGIGAIGLGAILGTKGKIIKKAAQNIKIIPKTIHIP